MSWCETSVLWLQRAKPHEIYHGQLDHLANIWLWSNMACDTLISGFLLLRLWYSKRGLNPELALPGTGLRADSLVTSVSLFLEEITLSKPDIDI